MQSLHCTAGPFFSKDKRWDNSRRLSSLTLSVYFLLLSFPLISPLFLSAVGSESAQNRTAHRRGAEEAGLRMFCMPQIRAS